jgi:eukaryotic-like serine/threonine-protein kinase
MAQRVIEFPGPKQFTLEAELGQGACGKTVVIHDATIDERFVCKKYSPIVESLKQELFSNFVREIKLLYLINHQNIVRVFNYYLYPDKLLGYILMEYVKGPDIEEYLRISPENINEVFKQTIEGFSYLEEKNILHRDIRPFNLLVSDSGQVKIINFGFGKQAMGTDDFHKSVSLNWWCEVPIEFKETVYDFRTELYFVGKLFEKILLKNSISGFKHTATLKQMCEINPLMRTSSFADIKRQIFSDAFIDIDFPENQLETYRHFSNSMRKVISKIENSAKYYDVDMFQMRLEELYKRVMLEESVPKNNLIATCIVNGGYYYSTNDAFWVSTIRDFIDLLRSSSKEKRNIIYSNLQTKLDTIARYSEKEITDDDIPF